MTSMTTPYHTICPFNREIVEYRKPHGFETPEFQLYDGTTDPYDHLYSFKATVDLYNLPEPELCKLFWTTLTGNAGRWFYNLLLDLDNCESLVL
ncbi:hypothetical protein CTI12_AA151490 [Artemisia annua]|uniref:Retrotransposon gag protein n=1 Tax=Artemisia annua TaxID=35608 RepID=A0A2U1PHE3_ARTAN|nr:hypothetical protein CTI12_AA151490 [Artemisia annua]